VLARALTDWLRGGHESGLEAYSDRCLKRVWRVQQFSWWMTSMLHRFPDADDIQARLQLAELDYVTSSRAASTMVAENYTGMPYA
jgi:p-hydroxybenzoate 3-monooxygenase